MKKTLNPKAQASAFTLIELLVIVVILGVLSAISVVGLNSALNRSRLNTAAFLISGWMEKIRNESASQVNSDVDAGGCSITFAAASNISQGDLIASSANCGNVDPSITLPDVGGNSLRFEAMDANGNPVSNPGITLTPRGSWIYDDASPSGDLYLKVFLNPSGPMRCVRVSEILGSVDIGRANINSVGQITANNCGSFSEV